MPHRRTSINTKSWATAIAVSGIVLVSIIGYFLLQTVLIEGSLFPYGEDSWRHYSTGGTFYTTAPSISPDCASVAFSSPATGHSDIYLYERSSEESHRITSTDDFESAPHFVDGGKRIAYVRESKRCRHIWIIDPRTRQTKQVTFGDVLDDILAVSNDGSHILLMRSDVTIGLGRSVDFHLLNIKDLNTTPLGVGSFAALSASGRLVAYTPRGVINEIWILDLETGERSFACQADSAAFSPDERFLVASRAGQQWARS